MRAKQSTTASGIDRRSGPLTPLLPSSAAGPSLAGEAATCPAAPQYGEISLRSGRRRSRPGRETVRQEGLLHDARNLMGAIGLYSDLLSMPDVLQPEHRHYAEELRLLGSRSAALIQQLMQHQLLASPAHGGPPQGPGTSTAWEAGVSRSLALAKVREAEGGVVKSPISPPGAVSLRTIIERCSGLLSRVADGRTIEMSYGAAASVLVPVAEEAVERILVNLVRNSAAAMRGLGRPCGPAVDARGIAARNTVLERVYGRDSGGDPDWGGAADQPRGRSQAVAAAPGEVDGGGLRVWNDCGAEGAASERVQDGVAGQAWDRVSRGAGAGRSFQRRPESDKRTGYRHAGADRMAGDGDCAGGGTRRDLHIPQGSGFEPAGRSLRIVRGRAGAARGARGGGSGCG